MIIANHNWDFVDRPVYGAEQRSTDGRRRRGSRRLMG